MTFIPLDANLRPFGAQTPHTDGFRYENAASQHSSFRAKARNLFLSRQGKGCERNGKRETPYSLRPPKTVFHADRSTQEKEHGKRKRSLGSARDDDTRMTLSRTTFSPLREPTSTPLGHLLPREGGRMPPHRLLMKMAHDTRIPLPRIRHFERKREIFFVRGKAKDVRGTTSGKHRTPCAPEERCFMQTDSRMKQKMANEKDPSAALGITIRANAPPARHFSPLRCQPPPLRGTSFHGKEGECRFTSST